jgi:hypothetical protein
MDRIHRLTTRPFILLLVTAILVSCGGPSAEEQTSTAFNAQVEQTTTAANACVEAAVGYRDEMKPITLEWADAIKLAGQTSRAQLANQVAALQAIKRKADAVTVPACAEVAHGHLVASMNASIDGFLAFMSQKDDLIVNANFDTAKSEMAAYADELLAATTGPKATAVPGATAAPPTARPEMAVIPDDALPGILWMDGDIDGLKVTKAEPAAAPFKGGVTSVSYALADGTSGSDMGRLTLTLFNTPQQALDAVEIEHTAYTSKHKGVQFPKITDLADVTYATIGESPELVILARCTVAVRVELKAKFSPDGLKLARTIDDRARAICLP